MSKTHENVTPGRRIIHTRTAPMGPYDYEGPVQPDMWSIDLSYDRTTRQGSYLLRMAPGTATIPHEHPFCEEHIILEGEVIESDGTVLKPGDYVIYEPGSHHNSRTETGCLVLGIDWTRRE
jgi:hypothetical protein